MYFVAKAAATLVKSDVAHLYIVGKGEKRCVCVCVCICVCVCVCVCVCKASAPVLLL